MTKDFSIHNELLAETIRKHKESNPTPIETLTFEARYENIVSVAIYEKLKENPLNDGLRQFHCSLGPEAMDMPFSELVDNIVKTQFDIDSEKIKSKKLDFLDSDLRGPKNPKISISEFVGNLE